MLVTVSIVNALLLKLIKPSAVTESTKIIADQLNISFHTARSHLKNIYIKLHMNGGKETIAKL